MSRRNDAERAPTSTLRRRFGARRVITLLIGAMLAAALAWTVHHVVGWRAVGITALSIGASYWIGFVGLLSLSYATRVVRLWRLLRNIKPNAQLARSAAVFFVHNGFASLLPARIGEAALPLLARRWMGIDWASVIGALTWWRLVDVAVVGAIALLLLAMGADVLAPLYVFAFAACALPLIALALRRMLLRLGDTTMGGSATPAWRRFLRRALAGMPARAGAVSADLLLAITAWSTKLAAFSALIAGALQASMAAVPATVLPGLRQLAGAALAGDVAGALPTPSIAGVGPFEAGLVLGLQAVGIELAQALAVAVLLHAALLATIAVGAVSGLLGGLLLDRRRPARRSGRG